MFNISGFELILIGIVALLVIGPERLPQVARTIGGWIGKARRMAHHVQNEIMNEEKTINKEPPKEDHE